MSTAVSPAGLQPYMDGPWSQ